MLKSPLAFELNVPTTTPVPGLTILIEPVEIYKSLIILVSEPKSYVLLAPGIIEPVKFILPFIN